MESLIYMYIDLLEWYLNAYAIRKWKTIQNV